MVRFDTTADEAATRNATPDNATPGNAHRKPAPNYFSRAQQYRLLVMVFTLMLVLFLMMEAAKPKTWQWMWQVGANQNTAANQNMAASHASTKRAERSAQAVSLDRRSDEVSDVDTRLPERETYPPGVFVIETRDNDRETNAPDSSDPPESIDAVAPGRLVAGIQSDELNSIRDDTVFRSAESEVWFHWCEIVRDNFIIANNRGVRPMAVPTVTFLQLFRQPNEYRGKAVHVSGIVRRAHQVPARENDKGVQGYYRCWLFPTNGSNNPIVVYALQMPEGFPTGMELHEEVSFSGVFFKRWAYQAQGGIMTAPLVLSAGGAWAPVVPPPPLKTPSLPWALLAIAASAVLGGVIAWAVYRQSNAQSAEVRRARDLPESAPNLTENSVSAEEVDLSIDPRDEGQRA